MVNKPATAVPSSLSSNLDCQYSSVHTTPVISAVGGGSCSALLIISEAKQESMLQLTSGAAMRSQLSPLLAVCPNPHRINCFVIYALLEEISRWIYKGEMCSPTPGAVLTLGQFTDGSHALSPPHNSSAAASSPQEILQKPLKRKESSMCLIFIVVCSFPFRPPSKLQQICAFLQ